ncbi:MAG: SPFH domain-containing protein [Gammaproteobacteria bacterium]|nr:SPFH domain-containing protein [Gammaproteobacteria bacterium]
MGLFDKLRGEFIDVIEWVEDDRDTLVYRFPTYNREIQMGSSLIVRETQRALFVYQGQIADLYEPGHYKLSTANMPIMTTLQHWTHGFNSPFKSEVYYFNTRQFTDLKWGTPNPVTLRDADFGVLRIRAFGSYTLRVADPERVMRELSGTAERYSVEDVQGQLRAAIITRFSDFIAESKVPFLDYAANLNEFSAALVQPMKDEFARFGLDLDRFFIQNISLPPNVEKALDQRASMAAIGDMDSYTRYQVASSIPDAMAAGGDGGLAGAGVGAGLGVAIGNAIGGAIGGVGGQAGGAPAGGQAAGGAPKIMVRCPECSTLSEETAKFCANCGYRLIKG